MQEFRENIHTLADEAVGGQTEYLLWEAMPVNRERPSNVPDALELHEWINDGARLPIRICLDTGHTCAYDNKGRDLDPYYWIRQLGRFSPVIHVQQSDGKIDHHWPFTDEYNAVGIVDAERLIEAVQQSGAEAVLLILEIIHPFEAREARVLDDLRRSIEYWKTALSG